MRKRPSQPPPPPRTTEVVRSKTPDTVRLGGRKVRLEIRENDVRRFIGRHIVPAATLGVILVAVGALYLVLRTDAQVAFFYPTACLGGWENSANAQGMPEVSVDADDDAFTSENSAVLYNANANFFCGSFTGTVPPNVTPTEVTLHLSFLLTTPTETNSHPNPPAEEDAPTQETSYLDHIRARTALAHELDEGGEEIEEAPVEESQPEEPAPDPEAENASSTPAEIEPPLSAPPPLPEASIPSVEPPILEFEYTLDGETWQTLGTVYPSQRRDVSFSVSPFVWEDISRFQVQARSVPHVDGPYIVYVDAMWLAVEYEELENPVQLVSEETPAARNAFLPNATSSSYYYIFAPQDIAVDGGFCATLTGAAIAEYQYNLKDQGTCFVNDTGSFEILEMSEPTTGTYKEFRQSEHFLSIQTLSISPLPSSDETIPSN